MAHFDLTPGVYITEIDISNTFKPRFPIIRTIEDFQVYLDDPETYWQWEWRKGYDL